MGLLLQNETWALVYCSLSGILYMSQIYTAQLKHSNRSHEPRGGRVV